MMRGTEYDSASLSEMKIRLPSELRRQIEAAANSNKRKMNAEIVSRLERTFAEDAAGDEARIHEIVKAMFEESYEGDIDELKDAVAGLTELLNETRTKLGFSKCENR